MRKEMKQRKENSRGKKRKWIFICLQQLSSRLVNYLLIYSFIRLYIYHHYTLLMHLFIHSSIYQSIIITHYSCIYSLIPLSIYLSSLHITPCLLIHVFISKFIYRYLNYFLYFIFLSLS